MARRRRPRTTAKAKWSRREYLVDALVEYEAMADAAHEAGSFQAAVRAKMQAAVTRSEIDQLDQADALMDIPDSIEAHRDEVIRQVRRLRSAAEASNSFTAAGALLKLEAELVEAADSRARAAEAPDARSMEEVLEELRERAEALPLRVRQMAGIG